jgi:hypothetical protein
MWTKFRDGDWITGERLKVYPLMLLAASALAIFAMIWLTNDRLGPDNKPLGTDFSQVWVAGRSVLAGHPEAPFDLDRHIAEQHREFGAQSAVYGWHYPPYFLAVAAPLARLPYLQALLVWQLSTLALYLAAVAAILRDARPGLGRVFIAALAFPAVLVNLGHGQNGFLTAALLGGGFLLLDRRPALAGALLALLAYKPQFALVLPAALIAGRQWRALGAAAVALALMTLASVAAFGLDAWRAFLESLSLTRSLVVEQGATGFEKIQSVFAAVRLMGGSVSTAYAAQSVATVGAIGALIWLWRSRADFRIKAAAAVTATLVATPYCLDYDMMALAPAMAFVVAAGRQCGFLDYEKSLLALVFFAPLLARPVATFAPAPLGAAMISLLFLALLRHGRPAPEPQAAAGCDRLAAPAN